MDKLLRQFALPGLVAALAALLLLTEGRSGSPGTGAERPAGAPRSAETVPAFEARSLAGHPLSFPAHYRGKLVLLDFWATWCPPCLGQIPSLTQAYDKFHDRGLEIIGVTLDKGHASAGEVQRFAQSKHMPWEQIYDDASALAADYHVVAIPAAFLLDGDTGHLLADGDALLGDALLETIARHLRAKLTRP